MNKLAKWILVMIAVTAVCTATAEAAKWKFTPQGGYTDPEWGVFNGNGWLTVWPTINCNRQEPVIFERQYVEGGIEQEGEIPKGKGYNDWTAYFEWDYPCGNKVWYKLYVCNDGELRPVLLPEWIDGLPQDELISLTSLGDPTGTDPNIYIVVNFRVAHENPVPPQETYTFNNGVCEQLPGYQVGTTPFVDKGGEIPCHPFETDNLFTGTLYPHADIGIISEGNGGHNGVVPTLSEWGLIVMALLLVAVGAIAIRRRKRIAV